MAIPGFATDAGTQRYRARHATCHPDHFRSLRDLWVSSIGLGTYLGDPDDRTDALYAEAIAAALDAGCNLLDTASNYRFQRSERVIGATLERLVGDGAIARDEVVLCTKGGYIPFDGEMPADPGRYIIETLFRPGLIQYDDVVANSHVLTPRYLEHQLAVSLRNLRVETVDIYYLHNPEQQLDEIPREKFLARIEAAFSLLERKVQEGAIRLYGTATWNGYRGNPQDRGHLSLEELTGIARRAGGDGHHFRVIQAPLNLAMPEIYAFKNQSVNGQAMSLLDAAAALGLSVVASASLLQSQLVKLPGAMAHLIPNLRTDAQRAIQFVRSTPGVTTALVGTKHAAHVTENASVAAVPPLAPEHIAELFTPIRS